jgi:hypothetical protein
MAIKDEALVRALRTLDVLGAKYKVITATGEEHGELEVVKRQSGEPRNHFKQLGYAEVVAALNVGDVAKLPLPSDMSPDNAERYRGTIASKACQLWGKGNTMTAWADDRQAIEILRIM